jgi:hypothetical protein
MFVNYILIYVAPVAGTYVTTPDIFSPVFFAINSTVIVYPTAGIVFVPVNVIYTKSGSLKV